MESNERKVTKKIINILLNILIFIFSIILLISIYTSIQTKILGNKYADFFGYSIFEVQTGSMKSAINPGDWIIVKLTKEVKLDDIITYETKGEYVTHRIVEVYNGTYITQGDANNAKDDPVDQNQIVGKVINVLVNFGLFRKTLFNPSVIVTLIITLFLFNLTFKKDKSNQTTNESDGLIFDSLIKKVNSFLEQIKNSFSKNIKYSKEPDFYNEKMIDLSMFSSDNVSEDELEKTIFYRNITVLEDEVTEKYKMPTKIPEDELDKTSIFKVTSADDESQIVIHKIEEEDELEKTIFYRNIPVNEEVVDEKYKNEQILSDKKSKKIENNEDELDKTAFYRVIPVDMSELDNTFLEIAENEIKSSLKKEPEKRVEIEEKEIVTKETLTNIDLDLIRNKKNNKKGKNIIDTIMIIKKEELNELLNLFIQEIKTNVNIASIKNSFIDIYIEARYYNHYYDTNIDLNNRNILNKIKPIIKETATNLINNYRGSNNKYANIVNIYADTFILITILEQGRDSITDLKAKKEFYEKQLIKYNKEWDNKKTDYLIDKIIKIQKEYVSIIDDFFKKTETNVFNLNLNKLTSNKNMFGLELEHNIIFSKVYSNYIIDKTYTEGIVAEDMTTVLLTLLSAQLIKDMFTYNFNNKYILYIPNSLYEKEKKFEKLLRMFDDKYAKENVIMLIKYKDLIKNKKIIKKVRKMGYRFAIVFEEEVITKEKDHGNIYIADYLFINKNDNKTSSLIPEDLINAIIYEDILKKVGNNGGD